MDCSLRFPDTTEGHHHGVGEMHHVNTNHKGRPLTALRAPTVRWRLRSHGAALSMPGG
jgi:hypothetical protein